ncbi:MAG: hypothetical protein JWP88_354 [Flaviaesturariibacter sp.]|nr:hypothetical protein [Flaviaesturariibacter sp.]
MKQKSLHKDHGKDLYHAILFLLALLALLWHFKI